MSYRIDIQQADVELIGCAFVASKAAGKTLCVNEDGSSLVVEPNGTERPGGQPPNTDNWDSAYTQAEVHGDLLVYRSANGADPGVPRAYRMVL